MNKIRKWNKTAEVRATCALSKNNCSTEFVCIHVQNYKYEYRVVSTWFRSNADLCLMNYNYVHMSVSPLSPPLLPLLKLFPLLSNDQLLETVEKMLKRNMDVSPVKHTNMMIRIMIYAVSHPSTRIWSQSHV